MWVLDSDITDTRDLLPYDKMLFFRVLEVGDRDQMAALLDSGEDLTLDAYNIFFMSSHEGRNAQELCGLLDTGP